MIRKVMFNAGDGLNPINMSNSRTINIFDKSFAKATNYDRNETKSNLPFQMLLYVNLWLFPAWLLITASSLDVKYGSLTNAYKALTLTVFLTLLVTECLKLYLGYLGNLAGTIPEMASCWLISVLIQLPLEIFVLSDHGMLLRRNELFIDSFMICLLLLEIITGTCALKNLANRRAKTFYLMQLCEGRYDDGITSAHYYS